MNDIGRLAQCIKNTLKMNIEPVGVHLFATGAALPAGIQAHEPETALKSYCQGLARAARGEILFGGSKKMGCVLGTSVLGLEADPEPLLDDSALEKYGVGLFATEEASRQSVDRAPKYGAGSHQAVLMGPLGKMPVPAELVILEVDPEQTMWVLYAANHDRGGPQMLPQSGGVAGGCADVTTFVLGRNEVNVTFLGLGCRMKSAIPSSRLLVGIPMVRLEALCTALEGLKGPMNKLAGAPRREAG
jgi:uncharacterized protein (DUF169 family)